MTFLKKAVLFYISFNLTEINKSMQQQSLVIPSPCLHFISKFIENTTFQSDRNAVILLTGVQSTHVRNAVIVAADKEVT